MVFLSRFDTLDIVLKNGIVACRPLARQRQRSKQTVQQPLLSNGSANKHVSTATVTVQ
jgi:hypothetical protein